MNKKELKKIIEGRTPYMIGFGFGGLILFLVQWGIINNQNNAGTILGFGFLTISLYLDICDQLKEIKNKIK